MSRKFFFKSTATVIFALLFILMAGCEMPDVYFVRVSSIEGVPETGEVDVPLALNATVQPDFASHKDIKWSVKDAGGTEGNISGNILTARKVGIVIISARIINGIMEGKDYIQDFEVTISRDGIKPITKVTLTVPGPAKGRVPVTNPASVKPSAEDSGKYTIGKVEWTPPHDPFWGLIEYSVTVTLTADTSHYIFATDRVAAKINGSIAKVEENTGETITLSHKFTKTSDKEITGITVKKQPEKLTYTENEELDLSGLVVTISYDIGPSEDVPFSDLISHSSISVLPEDGETLYKSAHNGKRVEVSAGDYTASTNPLTVNEVVATIGWKRWFSSLSDAINGAENGTASEPTEIIILKNITAGSGFSIPAGKNIRLNVEENKNNTIAAEAGDFALFNVTNTDSSLALGPTSGTGKLTLTGNNLAASANRRGVYVKGGTLSMNSGVLITGFNNDRGDVFVANDGSSGRIILSGNAELDTLTLSADAYGNAVAEIASDWNAGYIGKLNLQGSGYPIASVIQQWKGKTVLQGSWLNVSNVENMNFKLWNFIDAQGGTQRMNKKELNAPYGYAIGDSGQDMGKLVVAQFNIYLEAQRYKEANEDITIRVPHDYIMPRALVIPDPGKAGITLTIMGDKAEYKIIRGNQDPTASNGLFIVNSGVKLVFEGIVVDGDQGKYTGNTASLVRVNAGGTFTMNAGAILQNNRAASGGGVYVVGTSTTVRGMFIMNDGSKIINNTAATSGGGVYADSYVTFTMSDGEISGNSGAGVYFNSSNGTFTMSGGEIKNNTGSSGYGVYAEYGTFNMSGGTISSNSSGGVRNETTFNMSGGTISGNSGSGVYNYSGTFTMSNGTISGNTATTNGGGVYVYSGTFTMNNGTISGNTANGTGASNGGGGVYVSSGRTFNMYGGEISGNKAAGNGGGVYNNGTFRVGGTAKVKNSTGSNAYITGSTYITLGTGTNVPADGMEIWTQTARADNVVVSSGATYNKTEKYFRSDEGKSVFVLGGTLLIGDSLPDEVLDFYAKVEKYGDDTATANMIIIVPEDLTLPIPVNIPAPGTPGITLTIKGAMPTVKLTRGTEDTTADNGLFIVPSGASLVFEEIVVDGDQGKHTGNTASLVRVNAGGTFTMNAGAILQNNRAASGGGVYVVGTSTTVRGMFIMNDGEISGNTVTSSGGGVYADNYVTFTMSDGGISGNSGAGVYFNSSNGTFTMSGGEIKNNTGSSGYGVYAEYGTFNMSGGTISSNSSGGVRNETTFNMSGGTISGNSGSGVYNYSGTFTMSNGTISGNTATTNGGGVYVYSGTFTMNNGTISGNTANGTGASNGGGGVYVSSGRTFNMYGGEISGNKAAGNGGGVYNNGTFRVGGAAKVSGNTKADNTTRNNVYLPNTNITLGTGTNAPAAGMEIWAQTTRTNCIVVSSGATLAIKDYFEADEDGKLVDVQEGRLLIGNSVDFPPPLTPVEMDFYDKVKSYANATANMIIIVPEDLTLPIPVNIPAPGTPGITLTIKGATPTVKLTRGTEDATADNGLFIVPSGASLIFEEIVVDGNSAVHIANTASLVRVNAGGTFTMNAGAILQNNRAASGGGVYVVGTSTTVRGMFIMNSGSKIINNTATNGGGVYADSYVTFTMNDGGISGNTATYGGGVYADNYVTFTMSDGGISGNSGAGVYFNSSNGTFNMSGGEIKNNTGSSGYGVYVYYGTFNMSGGTISGNSSGGVRNETTFNMSGGTISGNSGSGVYNYSGTFTMSNGTISGNTATTNGGGVYVYSGTFTMNNGTISGNTANGTGASNGGGGVYVSSGRTFNMYGGEISGNKAAGNGSGVFVDSTPTTSGTFRVGGAAKVRNNTRMDNTTRSNVYITASTYITLGTGVNAPASGMEIWSQTARPDTVLVQIGATAAMMAYFKADEAGKSVVFDVNALVIK